MSAKQGIGWHERGTFSTAVNSGSKQKVTRLVADENITDIKQSIPQEGNFTNTLYPFRVLLVPLYGCISYNRLWLLYFLCFLPLFRTEHPVLLEKHTAFLQLRACFDLSHVIFLEQVLPFCSYQSRLCSLTRWKMILRGAGNIFFCSKKQTLFTT